VIRTHYEPTQYCFIKLGADGCLSITQNDDVIDILLIENEKSSEQKGGKRGRNICNSNRCIKTLGITILT